MDKRNRSTHVDSKKNYQGWQHNGKFDRRTPPHAVKTENMDERNLSSRTEEGEDLQAWQQYARSPGMPVDVMPEKRPKTRSYRSHHSTPSNHSRESSNSFGRIRFRTVKRIPTETPSNANLSPSRRPATAQQEVSHTHQLARDTEDFNRRIIAVMEQTYSKKNGQDVRPSSCKRKGKPREVWPQTRESEVYKLPFNDETHYYSKPSDICEGRNVLYEQQRTRSNEKYKVKQVPKSKHDVRASSDEAARIISSNQCSRPKNSNQDKKILLSQIRKQRFNLKSASERPENPQLPKSNNEMDMMFAAIQNGVVLKHIEVPTKNSNQNQKSPTTALLAQLQERKKAYMRLEGTN